MIERIKRHYFAIEHKFLSFDRWEVVTDSKVTFSNDGRCDIEIEKGPVEQDSIDHFMKELETIAEKNLKELYGSLSNEVLNDKIALTIAARIFFSRYDGRYNTAEILVLSDIIEADTLDRNAREFVAEEILSIS